MAENDALADAFAAMAVADNGAIVAAMDLWQELVATLVEKGVLSTGDVLAMARRIEERSALPEFDERCGETLRIMANRLRAQHGPGGPP